MRFLITGGLGFIGSHLADALVGAGHVAHIIDDMSTGKRENAPDVAHVVIDDITRAGVFDALIPTVDGVFHLAAVASVEKSKTDWLRTHQVNLSGTVALFAAIAKSGKKIPVVYASSAAVYGDNQALPLSENSCPNPISAYGADKLACEIQAKIASEIHAIPTLGLRFFNVYGARQDPLSPYSGVISIFADKLKRAEPVTIFGDGEQSRDFIYVGDVVAHLMQSMQVLHSKTLHHAVVNVCSAKATSLKQLVAMLVDILHMTPEIHHAPERKGDIRDSLGCNQLAQKHLGLQAETTLKDGLQLTLLSLA